MVGIFPPWLILSYQLLNASLERDAHSWCSQPVRIGSMTPLPAPFLLACLPSFLPMTGERAAEEQGPTGVLLLCFPSGIMFWRQWITPNLYPPSPFSLQPENSEITLEIK